MKKLLLSGCGLIADSYTVVQEHTASPVVAETDAVTVANYDELRYAILSFVEMHQESGLIQSTGYDGNASNDAAAAAYDIWKNDPDGAYAIDFITTDCKTILTRSEITVTISYRDGVLLPGAIPYVRGSSGIQTAVDSALSNQRTAVTIRVSNYPEETDYAAIVQEYCSANPLSVMEQPKVTPAVYPAEGSVRIVELTLDYAHDAETLANMQTAVNEVVNAAISYVGHLENEAERADLLVRYLLERFSYRFETTSTPAYSLLCEGVTDSRTLAQVFAALCEQADLNCQVVSGYRNGEPHYWNILELSGGSSHADLFRLLDEGRTNLTLWADSDMTSYSWDRSTYPPCGTPISTAENPNPPESPKSTEETAEASTPTPEESTESAEPSQS